MSDRRPPDGHDGHKAVPPQRRPGNGRGPVTASTGVSQPVRSHAEVMAPKRAPRRPQAAAARRESRRLGPVLKFFNATLTFVAVMMLAAGGAAYYFMSGLDADGPLAQNKLIVVPKNDGSLAIAEKLERDGVIASRHSFLVSYWLMARQAAWSGTKPVQLKAGDYEIKQSASMRSVIETLAEGRTVLMRVTIPEGLTSYQIVERLKADQGLSGDLKEVPPEGSLLPETYSIPRGSSRVAVVEAMQAAQNKLVEQLWAEKQDGLPLRSPQEALVLASIVEKETGKNDERDRVAAVFVNRLRANMRLQSDPTILYGLALGKVQWGKPILRTEIQSNTAHNTYVIAGLPPTPVCNPGRAAIEATLKPAASKELYFVADGKGGHIFAETLKDHNANVAKWREIERAAQQRSGAAAAPAPVPATTLNSAAAPAAVAPVVKGAPVPAAPAGAQKTKN